MTLTALHSKALEDSFESLSIIDGKVSREIAAGYFKRLNLPEEITERIWRLADLDNDDALKHNEYFIAMALVDLHRKGKPLPDDMSRVTVDHQHPHRERSKTAPHPPPKPRFLLEQQEQSGKPLPVPPSPKSRRSASVSHANSTSPYLPGPKKPLPQLPGGSKEAKEVREAKSPESKEAKKDQFKKLKQFSQNFKLGKSPSADRASPSPMAWHNSLQFSSGINIVFAGEAGVGKTTLIKKLTGEQSQLESLNGIQSYRFDDTRELWEVSGLNHDKISAVYSAASLIFVCFAVDSAESFDKVNDWIKDIRKRLPDSRDVKIVLLGLKADAETEQKVTTQWGIALANLENLGTEGKSYLEVSSNNDLGLEEVKSLLQKTKAAETKKSLQTEADFGLAESNVCDSPSNPNKEDLGTPKKKSVLKKMGKALSMRGSKAK